MKESRVTTSLFLEKDAAYSIVPVERFRTVVLYIDDQMLAVYIRDIETTVSLMAALSEVLEIQTAAAAARAAE